MLVSVIIPVYNAESYVRQAVESALAQPETGEVILIEDASPDDSLQVCQELVERYDKVKLFRHPDGKNHGAGASRNVGIKKAQFDFISFLDADDYFLPHRFEVPNQIFLENEEVNGVYEAVGVHFEDESIDLKRQRRDPNALTTMLKRVPPEKLFEAQSPIGPYGYCPTGGWVVKRDIFNKTGLFDEHLRLHQDTVLYVKFAALGKIMPGRLNQPVAMRRLHSQNRSSGYRPVYEAYRDRLLMWGTLWEWGKENLDYYRYKLILRKFIDFAALPYRQKNIFLIGWLRSKFQLLDTLKKYPGLTGEFSFWVKLIINAKAFVRPGIAFFR
jgi:glycosyltransferase involved in cell wall biosynthesis